MNPSRTPGLDPGPAPGRSLVDPERLAALTDLGLSRRSDPGMERYAARVRDALGVPVSLVSLVQADEQVFPGMCGLPDPWATQRSTPLSHSFCQHVVTSGRPLVIHDARLDPLVAENLATMQMGVVAYAGVPLTDDQGNVLGSLCAIQSTPRAWTPDDLAVLDDIATDCSNDIRLRLSRLDGDHERVRRDAIDARLQQLLDWSQRLLTIAEGLNACRSVGDVRRLLTGLTESRTGLIDVVLHLPRPHEAARTAMLDQLIGHRAMVLVNDLSSPHEKLDDETRATYLARGARAAAFLRLQGSAGGPLGVVEMLWDVSRNLEPPERAAVAALGAYTAQALERALLIEDRVSVAHQLQSAMLAPLPTGTGLELAARYVPSEAGEMVGGDWYDVFEAPGPSSRAGDAGVIASIGDITGHDIAAATIMGQVRAMLRQVAWDRPAEKPSDHLAALEQACEAFDIAATGTAIVVHLTPIAGSSSWQMTWVNAGHPAPVLAEQDGTARLLTDHDLMFGHPELSGHLRRDHSTELRPGSTLVLYTDGLVDVRTLDPQDRTAQLTQIVRDHHAGGADAVVSAIGSTFSDLEDDVVVLAIHVPITG